METDYNLSDLDLSTDFRSSDDFDDLPVKRLKIDNDETGLIPGTKEYKRARKRRQNRESAARSRTRKKQEFLHLDSELDQVKRVSRQLMQQNSALKTQNELLQKELEFFRGIFQDKVPRPPKRSGYTSSFLAISLLCMVACICLVMPTSAGEEPNIGGRRLLFHTSDEHPVWGSVLWSKGWLLIPVIAASVWYWRARTVQTK